MTASTRTSFPSHRTIPAASPPGAITTLGRGGSDLTATVLGAALELPEVQVWKDVDGEHGRVLSAKRGVREGS